MNSRKRIEYIDALKGFAIYIVLWGHSLQYLKNGYDFYHNPLFEFIYSFHMPLFFVISGFFFRSSLKLNIKDFLYRKGIQLLLPCVVWGGITVGMKLAMEILVGEGHYLNDWFVLLKEILSNAWGIWFLRELFISYFILYISLNLCKKTWLACIISISVVLVSPYLCAGQRVLLPLFWAGFFIRENYSLISKYAKHVMLVSGIFYLICLFFWDGNYTMYVTGFPCLINFNGICFCSTNIGICVFRLFTGLCGSLFFFLLVKIVYRENKLFRGLKKTGANTLAIYLLQRIILEKLMNRIIDFPDMNLWLYNLLVTPLISLATLLICFMLINYLQKNKYAGLLLFGKIQHLKSFSIRWKNQQYKTKHRFWH